MNNLCFFALSKNGSVDFLPSNHLNFPAFQDKKNGKTSKKSLFGFKSKMACELCCSLSPFRSSKLSPFHIPPHPRTYYQDSVPGVRQLPILMPAWQGFLLDTDKPAPSSLCGGMAPLRGLCQRASLALKARCSKSACLA